MNQPGTGDIGSGPHFNIPVHACPTFNSVLHHLSESVASDNLQNRSTSGIGCNYFEPTTDIHHLLPQPFPDSAQPQPVLFLAWWWDSHLHPSKGWAPVVIMPCSDSGCHERPFMPITEHGSKTGTPVNSLRFSPICLHTQQELYFLLLIRVS